MPRIRPKQVIRNKRPTPAGMVNVPMSLKPVQAMHYPSDNTIAFERWYMDLYSDADETGRLYLPIQWTALYCNNKFGNCRRTLQEIQTFLNGLDKSKKYYTIVQYDDGILNDLTGIDIMVAAMSGPRIDYPIPLLCMPHKHRFNVKKDIFASFVGRVTHPIRAKMVEQLKDLPDYYISTKEHSMAQYCEIMARSKYALCPRGYGPSSFRICEAMQYNAVPVYISDEFIVPYNKIAYPLCHGDDLHGLHNQISVLCNYGTMYANTKLESLVYTYHGCKAMILNHLKQDEPKNNHSTLS